MPFISSLESLCCLLPIFLNMGLMYTNKAHSRLRLNHAKTTLSCKKTSQNHLMIQYCWMNIAEVEHFLGKSTSCQATGTILLQVMKFCLIELVQDAMNTTNNNTFQFKSLLAALLCITQRH